MLDAIVRRHKRLRVRRSRAVASVAAVLLIGGAATGVDLGTRSSPTTQSASAGPNRATGAIPPAVGAAPDGLSWISEGTTAAAAGKSASTSFGAPVAASTTGNEPATGTLGFSVTNGARPSATSNAPAFLRCSGSSCSPLDSVIGDAYLQHLFTRTNGQVTVRAFLASWTIGLLRLLPLGVASSPAVGSGASSGSGATTGSQTSTGSVAPAGTATGGAGVSATPATVEPYSTLPPSKFNVQPIEPSGCLVTRALVVEVSDAGAVAVVSVPLGPSTSAAFNVLSDQVVGTAEGSPAAVVVAHGGGDVASARAQFAAGGSDEMKLVDGWAVLVHSLPAGTSRVLPGADAGRATVTGLSATGSVLETASLPSGGLLAMALRACTLPASGGIGNGTTGSGSSTGGSVPPAASH